MIIKELKTEAEYIKSYILMSQLVEHLSEKEYITILHDMKKEGYRLFVLTDESDQYLSIVGFTFHIDFFNGKYMWISEMVTSKEARSKGVGKRLMDHLEDLAKEEHCKKIILYSGLSREGAHHFWEHHMGYSRRGIIFKKELE